MKRIYRAERTHCYDTEVTIVIESESLREVEEYCFKLPESYLYYEEIKIGQYFVDDDHRLFSPDKDF